MWGLGIILGSSDLVADSLTLWAIPLCPVLSVWKNLASRRIDLEQHPSPLFFSLLVKAHSRASGQQ